MTHGDASPETFLEALIQRTVVAVPAVRVDLAQIGQNVVRCWQARARDRDIRRRIGIGIP
ncbi:hypothetical protein AB4Z43_15455 [Mesorhizobium sp. 2RAF45]|uniref:hypothetical protein n=1 Tax=Mesorhizobium TaxID=68287 RepID=UPI001CB77FD4|nr:MULTISPECIES: hypothetical protein [Mesorhizobium]MCH4556911.1 hypothetical protein [Mesorhizobium jarvisii]